MISICKTGACTGCMACLNVCKKDAISIKETLQSVTAVIDENKCIHCGACTRVCPNNQIVEKKAPIAWYQGWSTDQEIRKASSSGGLASEISRSFILGGGAVCSCVFSKGKFIFEIADSVEQAQMFAGSKYVKSAPVMIYGEIQERLKKGQRVLFIGLPCQVAGVKNYIPDMLKTHLYTIDLICHGTPSPVVLQRFIKDHGCDMEGLESIKFRNGSSMGLHANNGIRFSMSGTKDRYLISFLNAINYTDNCYQCQYATEKRISDITLGDSWGSDLGQEIWKGISLILVQSEKGREILDASDVQLLDVDLEKAKQQNGQLTHPSEAPASREEFFAELERHKKYDRCVMKAFPKQCIKELAKGIAIATHLFPNRSDS